MQTYTTVIKGLLLLLQKFCTVVVIRSATFIARDLQPYTDITVTESQQTAVTQKVRGVMSENTGVMSDTYVGQQQSLHRCDN